MKIITILSVIVLGASTEVIPDYIPKCARDDPKVAQCILSSIDVVRPRLSKGIPELNVPSFKPLEIPELKINRNLEAINVKATLNKMKILGAQHFQIKSMHLNLDNYTATNMVVKIPSISVSTDYDIDGRLLLIPLRGAGAMTGEFSNITTTAKGSAKVVKKKGVQYLQISSLHLKTKIGNGKVVFTDSSNQPSMRLIAETAQNFFNGSPRLVLDIIAPIIDDTVVAIIKMYLNKMLGTIPLEELFD